MKQTSAETRRWLWPLLTLVIVVTVLATFSFSRQPRLDEPSGAGSAASTMPATGATPSAENAPREVSVSPDPEEALNTIDRAAREQQARIDQAKQDLIQLYQSEKTNPAWATTKERELLPLTQATQIQQMNAVPKQLDIDCKTSSCRVAAEFDNAGAANDWATVFTASLGSSMPTGTVQQVSRPDGTITIEVYGAMR
jgi:hypothetical protein